MIELGQILAGLIRRTTEGKMKWSRTAERDSFTSSVQAISVVVVRVATLSGYRYRLDILDESGEPVESLTHRDTAVANEQLERLYVLARRSAHNIDATLERLARGLEL